MAESFKEFGPFIAVIRRHLGRLVLGTLAGLAAAGAAVGLMSLAGWFIAAAAVAGLAPATAVLFNFFLPSIGVRLFAILRTAARYAERVFTHEATFRILESLRVWFYRRIEPLAPAGLWRFRSGDILNRIVSDIEALDNLYLRVLSPAAVALLVSFLVCSVLAAFDGGIAATSGLFLALAGIGVSAAAARAGAAAGRAIAVRSADLRVRLVECLQGLAEITLFGAVAEHLGRTDQSQSDLIAAERRMAFIQGGATAAASLLCGAAVLAALYAGSGLVADGRLSGAALVLIVFTVTASFETVVGLPAAAQFLSRTRSAGLRLLDVVESPPAVVFAASPPAAPDGFDVVFDGVSFRYRPELPRALDSVRLTIPQGRRVAVVGESGAGKSTLASLLVRFFDPETGAIRIGGRDIRALGESDMRRAIVVLSQQSHLFSATIRENLLIAKRNAGAAELRGALTAARLIDFVDALPDGLDTWVGEAGQLVSAGQARRLAAARAILRDAPVWVLDEPTEGLDRVTEAELVHSLFELTEGRTVLWITHRLVNLQQMDGIIVLDRGRVADLGTHAELLVRNQLYARWCARMI
ncbi:MAG TPA: thiol reductant ABC exporter subunit CydC [Desulfobacterales bacterium]|nr:thiol reductant ABC exporter subunit CydC [Desulfobacterales bacterium]